MLPKGKPEIVPEIMAPRQGEAYKMAVEDSGPGASASPAKDSEARHGASLRCASCLLVGRFMDFCSDGRLATPHVLPLKAGLWLDVGVGWRWVAVGGQLNAIWLGLSSQETFH